MDLEKELKKWREKRADKEKSRFPAGRRKFRQLTPLIAVVSASMASRS